MSTCPSLTAHTQTECAPLPLPIREPTGFFDNEKFVNDLFKVYPFSL